MTLAERIRHTFETATGLDLIYGTREGVNAAVESGKMPCGFWSPIEDTTMADGFAVREKVTAALSVVDLSTSEEVGYKSEEVVERCKYHLRKALKALRERSDIEVTGVTKGRRIYDDLDDIVTGYTLTVELRDLINYGCDGKPVRVRKEIKVNGDYDVQRVDDVSVNVQSAGIEGRKAVRVTANGVVSVDPSEGYAAVEGVDVEVDVPQPDGDRIVFYAFDGSGGKGAEFVSAEKATTVTWSFAGYHAWGIYMDGVTSLPQNPFSAAAQYPHELSFRSLGKVPRYFVRAECGLLDVLRLGTLQSWGANSLNVDMPNLREFEAGEGTDINITLTHWTATNVIAEGETACLGLIAGARTGIVERVKDHTGEADARTLTMPWVATLLDSEYESVQTALALLMADASAKGWSIAG